MVYMTCSFSMFSVGFFQVENETWMGFVSGFWVLHVLVAVYIFTYPSYR